MRGFLAMEYHHLILNRSFVLFIDPQGLYGCKFSGPVSAFGTRSTSSPTSG